MSFLEESSGTNAIPISMKLKKAIYTLPQHHYCAFLNKIHFYAKPLFLNDTIDSYLVLAGTQPINKELLAVSELLGYCIVSETRNRTKKKPEAYKIQPPRLSNKQVAILRLLASGMTDKATAIEMDLCFDTIKYHKKIIFQKLNASCTLEAVTKALKLNIISVDEINV